MYCFEAYIRATFNDRAIQITGQCHTNQWYFLNTFFLLDSFLELFWISI